MPQLGWVVVGAWLLFWFAGPLMRTLEQSSITKFGIGVFQVEVAQKIQQAATFNDQKILTNVKGRIEHTPRALFDAAVLWIDDNPTRNIVVRRALASLGLTVDTTQTTAEALTMLSRSAGGGKVPVASEPYCAVGSDRYVLCDVLPIVDPGVMQVHPQNRAMAIVWVILTMIGSPSVMHMDRVNLSFKVETPNQFGKLFAIDLFERCGHKLILHGVLSAYANCAPFLLEKHANPLAHRAVC